MENMRYMISSYIDKKRLGMYISVLLILSLSYLHYVEKNRSWIDPAIAQLSELISNPDIHFTMIAVINPMVGLLSILLIFFAGISLGALIFGGTHENKVFFYSVSIGLGIGAVGFITVSLIILQLLNQIVLLSSILILIVLLNYFTYKIHNINPFRLFSETNLKNIKISKNNIIVFLPFLLMVLLNFYHSIFYPVIEYDSLIYHAAFAKIIYDFHPNIPIIAGSSVGIEMSANYPPLFPALGAFFYIMIGNFNDFYMKLLSPSIFVLIISIIYSSGILLLNRKYGLVCSFLFILSPLSIMYARYETNYMILSFFITTSILSIALFMKYGEKKFLILSSLFLSFSLLTSYLALYYLVFFIMFIGLMVYQNKIHIDTLKSIMIILSLGGIWHLRNLFLLGDPVYPLGYGTFHSKFIEPFMLQATLEEIKYNSGAPLFESNILSRVTAQIKFILFDKGIFSPVIFTFLIALAWIKERWTWLFVAWSLFTISIFILIGWFWSRYFIIILPLMGMVAAIPIIEILSLGSADKVSKIIKSVMIVFIILMFIPAMLLGIMGVKSQSIKSNLDYRIDAKWVISNPGSNDEVLKKMYGDYSAWNWINENLKNDERIATFDAAIYYIDNYPNLFYLDGWEAKDLYRVSEPGDFLIYFYKQNITHIFIPAWAKLGNSRHPLYSKLRLKDYLNTDYFPLVYYIGESKIYKVNISKLRGEN